MKHTITLLVVLAFASGYSACVGAWPPDTWHVFATTIGPSVWAAPEYMDFGGARVRIKDLENWGDSIQHIRALERVVAEQERRIAALEKRR